MSLQTRLEALISAIGADVKALQAGGGGGGGGTKISALPAETVLAGTELVPIVQGGVTEHTTTAAIGATAPGGLSVENISFSHAGALSVKTGTSRFPIKGGTFQILTVAAMLNTAATGAQAILDVNKNTTSIYGTQGNRPVFAIGATSASVGAHTPTTVTDGDYIRVDIDQVGSTVTGSDLVLVIRLQRIS